jgi:hypothetical protein
MKKLTVLLISFCFVGLSLQAQLFFSDSFNYSDGCVETDGLWFAYSPAVPHLDADVTNDFLILNQKNYDSVAAPFTNTFAPSVVYASFTINVSTLPTVGGGYFCLFSDGTTNTGSTNDVSRIFIDATNTVVPGTYRLGIANFASYINTAGATNFPMDLATGITYQVVFSWDETSSKLGATLWVNPSSASDQYVYPNDTTNTIYLQNEPVSQIGFSQYANQGVMAIGNVMVGNTFGDVMTNVAELPVFGVQPQGTTNYSGNNLTLYSVASGMDVTYQWLSNNVPMIDDGVTVVGSTSNILNLTNLQNSANYSVVASDSAGSVTSAVAVVSIITTPTAPFFTLQPQGQTNSLLSPVTLTSLASGTGPITYQWYFEQAGGNTFSALSGATSNSLSFTAGYPNSGSYYVTASNSVSGFNSTTVNVLVIPPPLISIATLKSNIIDNNSSYNINGGQIYNVEGVVTSVGDILSGSTSEFYIQDGTGACLVYRGGFAASNSPAVGTLVNVISPAQSYYGAVEMDPTSGAATNGVYILSTNNPLPATIPLNVGLMATNDPATLGSYGWSNEDALVTLTNVYIYTNATGTAITGNFPTNSSTHFYAFQHPYSAGQPYILMYVYTYTNIANRLNTNYWGKPIPSFCNEITGINGVYSALVNGERFYPTRYADFVTNLPASLPASVTVSNGTPTVTWPAVVGSTYSIYSATNILGPWTQTFGLAYYPSVGAYTDTNASAAAQFYKVSTP